MSVGDGIDPCLDTSRKIWLDADGGWEVYIRKGITLQASFNQLFARLYTLFSLD